MSADLQQAVANEALELSYLFRQNAALKNGLPDCRKNTLSGKPDPQPERIVVEHRDTTIATQDVAHDSPSPGVGGAAETPQQSLLRRAAPFLLTAAIGSGLPLAAYYAFKDDPPPVKADDGSLLQALQDKGLHLPGGTWQTNPQP